MKLAPLLMLTFLGCTPESHTLLTADGGEPAPVTCDDILGQDAHGVACGSQGGGCGTPGSTGEESWWAGCNLPEGEFLVTRGTSTLVGEQSCEGAIGTDTPTGPLAFDSIDGPCFQIHHCDSELRWDLCQSPGRTGLRADAVATPFPDCESAIASARDGDPCTPGLQCAGGRSVVTAQGPGLEYLVLYCDEEGITRLIHADGFWFVAF